MVPATHRSILVPIIILFAAQLATGEEPKSALPLPRLSRIEDFAPPEEFVQVGSVKTHVVRRGESGCPIVLIHGFGSSTYTWRSNLGPLAKNHRVFAIDVKGFGLTAKPKDGLYQPDAFADHILGTLDVLKIDRPILVGSSMGGAIIARIALLHPERVAGVILVDPAPLDFGPPTLMTGIGNKLEKVATDGRPKLLATLTRSLINRKSVESGLRPAYHNPALVTPELVEATYFPLVIEGAPEVLIAMTFPPSSTMGRVPPLEGLKPPVLIVRGKYDRIIPARVADEYARRLPKAQTVIFERSGHLPHEEEPECFNRLVEEFASSIH